jgi:hypothetical protein
MWGDGFEAGAARGTAHRRRDCPGLNAVIRAASRFGTMVALHPPKVLAVPLARAVDHGRMKKVPLHSDILQSARDMGIGFGD